MKRWLIALCLLITLVPGIAALLIIDLPPVGDAIVGGCMMATMVFSAICIILYNLQHVGIRVTMFMVLNWTLLAVFAVDLIDTGCRGPLPVWYLPLTFIPALTVWLTVAEQRLERKFPKTKASV